MSFNLQSAICGLQSAVCSLQCAVCKCHTPVVVLVEYCTSIGSLSSDVFERRTSTGSEVFSLLTCLDDIKFVFLSFFTVIEAI